MLLSRFPRLHFAHLPTPLEPMDQLSKALGGPRLWVKRDDCTGLAGGGNKTRKLEFLLADALEAKADTIITQGATQSNHVRQTAAIAAKLGLACEILLEDRTGSDDPDYNLNGNVMLDQMMGANLQKVPGGTDMDGAMADLAAELRGQGKNPYVIPGGGSNTIGALGYAHCGLELLYQAVDQDLRIDLVTHATGSAGTQLAGRGPVGQPVRHSGAGLRGQGAPGTAGDQGLWAGLCNRRPDGLPWRCRQRPSHRQL